ncbi:hypothetical protein PFICI_11321 [Pestalotiopsis fici W106-1]|uniref:C2H2-type domain-containing protein n=1 Tax=Pestalotiopsis fici (strain W106-1 / CGMCC3.15140) TaxID=1229662 RepID=W3WWE6_PESFW|nr:uncharacterized protein PFICI_11321 [Pestalotiopsis fici W106-1]ETS77447.1 hypothetical protein PFICI_11321 [Pestalotiopsis fici W106-1]
MSHSKEGELGPHYNDSGYTQNNHIAPAVHQQLLTPDSPLILSNHASPNNTSLTPADSTTSLYLVPSEFGEYDWSNDDPFFGANFDIDRDRGTPSFLEEQSPFNSGSQTSWKAPPTSDPSYGQPDAPSPQGQSAQQVELDAETDPQSSNPDKADSNDIRHRTEACKHLFESCQTLCNDERVDRLCAKFHWWSLGIGASKHGHSSLDYRVRTREDIRDRIVDLLDMLAISLQSCISITAASGKEQITITAGSDTEPDHGHSRLEETMDYIRSNIDYLLRLSAAIRKSGTKFRHKHVDELLGDGKVDLREFGDYLRNLILFVPTQFAVGNAHQAYLEYPRRLGPIQERLIQANLVRRNRFDHYYKMSLKEDAMSLIAGDSRDQGSSPPRKVQKSIGAFSVDRSAISSRTATEIGTFVMPEKPRSHQTKSSSSRVSRSVLKQDYPRCPVTGKDFWCPFCAQPLDSSYSDPKKNMKWRYDLKLNPDISCLTTISGHVSEDLSPYTCIYPDCDQADAMYVTTDEWRKHLKSCHSMSRWICDICWLESSSPGDFEFDEEGKWREHSLSCHSGEISVQDLDDIAEESKRAVVPSIACPLCYDSTVLLQPDADKHIANHLHSFALQALPWTATVPDDETRASDGSNTGRPLYFEGKDDLAEIDWSAPYILQDLAPLLDESISRCQHLSRSIDFEKLRDTLNSVLETLHNLKQSLSSLSIAQVGEAADPMIRLNTILSRHDDNEFITSDMPTLEILGVDLEEAHGSLQVIVTKSSMKAAIETDATETTPPGK